MSNRRPAPIVAELGRPETPEETAARKAENSRNHRRRQTINNLVFSLLATLALVVVIVIVVPRGEAPERTPIDWSEVARSAQPSVEAPLADPSLPDGYSANYAELRSGSADGVRTWNIGLVSPSQQFIGITQAFSANDTWLAAELKNTAADTTTTIAGVTWTVYDNRDSSADVGNVEYALVADAGPSTFVVFGTATDDEFTEVAGAIETQVAANDGLPAEDEEN